MKYQGGFFINHRLLFEIYYIFESILKTFMDTLYTQAPKKQKNKGTAILLALLLGSFGGHRFYLGQTNRGITYLLFFWILIPFVASLIDTIVFAAMPPDKFNSYYNIAYSNDEGSDKSKNPVKIVLNDSAASQQDSEEKTPSKATAPEKEESLDSILEELNGLIGLKSVKEEITTLINFIKIQQERKSSGLKTSPLSYHLVFTGNPGTGKTTVARLISKLYKHLGILDSGHLVETDRSGLIAEYMGQTAVKVNKTVDSAMNGILFIDEAYSLNLNKDDSFGKEAVATIIKRIEDDRDKLVLILAGYTAEMKDFIDVNPGFESRINRYIEFPDYTPGELLAIFELNCKKSDYTLDDSAKAKALDVFTSIYSVKDRSFGNGRVARNVFENAIENQSNRIASYKDIDKTMLTTLSKEDILQPV